jgi:hypothetical protein
MKKTKLFILAGAISASVFLSSCSLTMPVNATSNPVGKKVGIAKATGYLGILFFNADASIQSAAKNGGITKISTVDIKSTNILNLIVTFETIVTGE